MPRSATATFARQGQPEQAGSALRVLWGGARASIEPCATNAQLAAPATTACAARSVRSGLSQPLASTARKHSRATGPLPLDWRKSFAHLTQQELAASARLAAREKQAIRCALRAQHARACGTNPPAKGALPVTRVPFRTAILAQHSVSAARSKDQRQLPVHATRMWTGRPAVCPQ